jgi:predicted MFS family arabinose efflux permease
MLFHIAVNHATAALGTPADRMQNFSILALGFSTANFLGPTAAGFAIDLIGHRNTFLMLAGSAGASLLVVSTLGLRVTPAPHQENSDGRRRIADLFRIPTLRRVLLVSAALSMAWDMFTFLVPIYGSQIGLSASQIGLILGTFGSAIFTVRVALPLVARRIGQWRMLTIAMIATGSMFFIFPLFQTLPLLMLISFLLGIGLGGAQPMIMSLVVTHAPAGRGGEAVGVRTLLLNCSQAGIPLIFGALGAAFGMAPVFWVMALALTGGGYLLRKPHPGQE